MTGLLRRAAVSAAALVMLSGCSKSPRIPEIDPPAVLKSQGESTPAPVYPHGDLHRCFGGLGSATELSGTTLVFSVFADDPAVSWDFDDPEDIDIYSRAHYNLGIACEWITEKALEYGTEAEFIYDWSEHPDLCLCTCVDMEVAPNIYTEYAEIYDMVWEKIESSVDSAALMERYDADNLIFMLFFDTPLSNPSSSCTQSYYDGMPYPYEVCFIFMGTNNLVEWPAGVAHEMLHCFGAPDLYYESEYGITQEYVDHAAEEELDDIMRITWPVGGKPLYDSIENGITDITAYYLGLTDRSETAEKWGLEPSQHQ